MEFVGYTLYRSTIEHNSPGQDRVTPTRLLCSCFYEQGSDGSKHINKKELTEQIFHYWTVIEEAGRDKHGCVLWLCECKCGNTGLVTSRDLTSKNSKSCGCYKIETLSLPESYAHRNSIFSTYKRNAKKYNRSFELSLDDFVFITKQDCHYCGAKPTPFSTGKHRVNGAYIGNGIDRKDNALGYTLENSLPCCWLHNEMKGTLSYEDFIIGLKTASSYLNLGQQDTI